MNSRRIPFLEILDYIRITKSNRANAQKRSKMSNQNDPVFIGRIFKGRFHDAESIHARMILTADDMKTLVNLAKAAKIAMDNAEDMPEGTGVYNGNWQIKLEIKQPRDKSKNPYCTLNTWKPDPGRQPAPAAANVSLESEDDMPF